jgi:hypothetical protein
MTRPTTSTQDTETDTRRLGWADEVEEWFREYERDGERAREVKDILDSVL